MNAMDAMLGLSDPVEIFTPKELAERWQCRTKTVRELIVSGALRAFHLGPNTLRVSMDAVEEYEKHLSAGLV